MKLRIVKASQGLVWVRQGMMACRQQPLGFIGLIGLVGFAALLMVSLHPAVGALPVIAAMPAVWLGFMLATRRVLTRQRITPSVMWEALKGPDAPRRQFLMLGALYLLATLGALELAQWLGPDQDAVDRIMETGKDSAEILANPMIQQDMLWRMGLTIPVSLLFWHTPAMLVWARVPVAKALFFSAIATWRNLGAFIVYGLCWMGVMVAIALLDRAVLAIVEEGFIANVLAVMAGMWVAGSFYASLYFTVVDCFEPQQPAPASSTES